MKLIQLLTNFGLTLKSLNWSKNSPLKKFSFKPLIEEFFKNIVINLSWNEAAGGDKPLNLIKEITFALSCLAHCGNEDLVKNEFLDLLKLSNIVPVQKKEDPSDKTNYGLVSVLYYYQNSLKMWLTNSFMSTWTVIWMTTFVIFARHIQPSMFCLN